ncbi:uncharacterized protein LOC103570314 [Microplitis demolitor]|uniref:uncharacterized protein LOC103570314 n=1 Tax=Microplitis demolitor TaxID=69319 RepID=UPI00235B5D7C|nr:uncharacterized protein LOC103570314 [Microplitis demolitor]
MLTKSLIIVLSACIFLQDNYAAATEHSYTGDFFRKIGDLKYREGDAVDRLFSIFHPHDNSDKPRHSLSGDILRAIGDSKYRFADKADRAVEKVKTHAGEAIGKIISKFQPTERSVPAQPRPKAAPIPDRPIPTCPSPSNPPSECSPNPVKPAPVFPLPSKPTEYSPNPVKPAPVFPLPSKPTEYSPNPVKPAPVFPLPSKPTEYSPNPVKPAPALPFPSKPPTTTITPEPFVPNIAPTVRSSIPKFLFISDGITRELSTDEIIEIGNYFERSRKVSTNY